MTNLQAQLFDQRRYRLTSIDMLRGLVLVIMVLDHARDFFIANLHDPMNDPHTTPWLFATRWITHFCAPVFVFLAGTSAGLMTSRKSAQFVGEFLFKRGLWLVFIEITIVSIGWTFSPFGIDQMDGKILMIMQVIWAIGASMIVLAGFQFLGKTVCLYVGAVILLGHNFLDPIWPKAIEGGAQLPLWAMLQTSMNINLGQFEFTFAYPLLPWFGVMLMGFGSASIFEKPPEKRNALLLKIGIAAIVLFVLLRVIGIMGEPKPWHYQPDNWSRIVMDFLNTTKYPPSLQYLLMTLGPAAIICAYADRWTGWWKETLVMFGRVPFTFYVIHIYLLHTMAIVLGLYQGFTFDQMMTGFFLFPKQYGVGLPSVYLAGLLTLVLLYPICRWVADVKSRRTEWWLSYV